MTPQKELERADRAKRILDDELYQETFTAVKEHLTRKMLGTAPKDTEEREQYFLQIVLLDKLRSTLNWYLEGGKVALARIDFERKKREAK